MSRLARGALCALLLSLSIPATASAAFGDRPLRMGMHGKDVRMLQTLLSKAGFVTVPDGYFGRRTRRSVGRWEADRDRTVNGAMSRSDQLALRHEFKMPISGSGRRSATRDRRHAPRAAPRRGRGIAALEPEHSACSRSPARTTSGATRPTASAAAAATSARTCSPTAARRSAPPRAASVVFFGYQGAAGNYIVIRAEESGEDDVYMHLLHAPRLAVGDRVETGQRIASVGRTGDADGCHLHFELWTEPGWYNGGEAYDPLPKLRQWDGWS